MRHGFMESVTKLFFVVVIMLLAVTISVHASENQSNIIFILTDDL